MAAEIVLVGGSASVGKTCLATELAALLRCRDVVHLDDVPDSQGRAGPFDASTELDSTGEQLLGLLLQETRTRHRPVVEIVARIRNERMSVLAREAERHDLPSIESQPWSTLCSRARAASSAG